MTIELEDSIVSDDIASYLDWALEMGLWDGRPVSRLEASEFHDEVAKRLISLLEENPDNPVFESLMAQLAWLGTPQAGQTLLARDIQQLDFSKSDLILQAGLKRSLSKFWKKHKKEILIGVIIVAVVTVVVVVSVTTAGTGAGAAGALGGAALAACDGIKDAPKKEPPSIEAPRRLPDQSLPPSPQLVFEETGISFDGQFTSYSNILLNQPEPTLPSFTHLDWLNRNELPSDIFNQHATPKIEWPKVDPPTFLDVQPHYATSWDNFLNQDIPNPIPVPKEQPFEVNESLAFEATEHPPEVKKSWMMGFLEMVGEKVLEQPDMLMPENNRQISTIFSTPGKRVPWLAFGGGNGMNTTMEEAISHANHIAQYTEGFSVDWVYNNSHGPVVDLLEIVTLNLRGFSPHTATLHRQQWKQFHENNFQRPNAKYLQFGHSQDSIHIFNALKKTPKEIRNRVIVILLGPAVVIPKGLCFRVRHYACEGDPIPFGEVLDSGVFGGILKGLPVASKHEDVIWLKRTPDTTSPHSFQGPPFKPVIKLHVDDYLEKDGEYLDSEADIIESNIPELGDLC